MAVTVCCVVYKLLLRFCHLSLYKQTYCALGGWLHFSSSHQFTGATLQTIGFITGFIWFILFSCTQRIINSLCGASSPHQTVTGAFSLCCYGIIKWFTCMFDSLNVNMCLLWANTNKWTRCCWEQLRNTAEKHNATRLLNQISSTE